LKPSDPIKTSDLPESEVIHRAQQGDVAAFEHLYRQNRPRVHALCLRMVRNSTEADDLTQEAFLQAFRKIQTFRGRAQFYTWLHRVTVNVVLMRLRRKSVLEFSLDQLNERSEPSARPPEKCQVPVRSAGWVFDRLSLWQALSQLPPGYRQMFILHDVQGYGHPEIAGILGCSEGNSKSQLFKARLRLRALLEGVR